MLIIVVDGGDGSGADSASYLVGAVDSKGVKRARLSVLRGDPVMVAAVIDSISNYLRYTSVAINLRDDRPTPEQIAALLDDLCRWTHAGLEPRAVCVLQVEHRKWLDHRLAPDLHVLMPRVELVTGLAFNPLPPGWEKPVGLLCDAHNFQHGWSRGTDPLRARPSPLDMHGQRKKRRKGGAEEGVDGNLIDLVRAKKARDAFERAVERRADVNRQQFAKRRLEPSGSRGLVLAPTALKYEQRLLQMVAAPPSVDLFSFIAVPGTIETALDAASEPLEPSDARNSHHDRNRTSVEQGLAGAFDQPASGRKAHRTDRRISGGGAGLAEAARRLGDAVQGLYGAFQRERQDLGATTAVAGKLARSLQEARDRLMASRALQYLARKQTKSNQQNFWWKK